MLSPMHIDSCLQIQMPLHFVLWPPDKMWLSVTVSNYKGCWTLNYTQSGPSWCHSSYSQPNGWSVDICSGLIIDNRQNKIALVPSELFVSFRECFHWIPSSQLFIGHTVPTTVNFTKPEHVHVWLFRINGKVTKERPFKSVLILLASISMFPQTHTQTHTDRHAHTHLVFPKAFEISLCLYPWGQWTGNGNWIGKKLKTSLANFCSWGMTIFHLNCCKNRLTGKCGFMSKDCCPLMCACGPQDH